MIDSDRLMASRTFQLILWHDMQQQLCRLQSSDFVWSRRFPNDFQTIGNRQPIVSLLIRYIYTTERVKN